MLSRIHDGGGCVVVYLFAWVNQIMVQARSLVGLIPLYATLVIENSVLDALPNFRKRMQWFCKHRADLVGSHITQGPASVLLSLVSLAQLPRILGRLGQGAAGRCCQCGFSCPRRQGGSAFVCVSLVPVADRMLDEAQFLSPFGIRSLSKEHEATPYHFESRTTLLPRPLPRLCLPHVSLSLMCTYLPCTVHVPNALARA